MQALYRIHTEDKPGTRLIVAKYFDGFTEVKALDHWKGQAEGAVVYEIYTDGNLLTECRVTDCAEEIRRTNSQESVLVVMLPLRSSRMVVA
jgi:hypothetical protein